MRKKKTKRKKQGVGVDPRLVCFVILFGLLSIKKAFVEKKKKKKKKTKDRKEKQKTN